MTTLGDCFDLFTCLEHRIGRFRISKPVIATHLDQSRWRQAAVVDEFLAVGEASI